MAPNLGLLYNIMLQIWVTACPHQARCISTVVEMFIISNLLHASSPDTMLFAVYGVPQNMNDGCWHDDYFRYLRMQEDAIEDSLAIHLCGHEESPDAVFYKVHGCPQYMHDCCGLNDYPHAILLHHLIEFAFGICIARCVTDSAPSTICLCCLRCTGVVCT